MSTNKIWCTRCYRCRHCSRKGRRLNEVGRNHSRRATPHQVREPRPCIRATRDPCSLGQRRTFAPQAVGQRPSAAEQARGRWRHCRTQKAQAYGLGHGGQPVAASLGQARRCQAATAPEGRQAYSPNAPDLASSQHTDGKWSPTAGNWNCEGSKARSGQRRCWCLRRAEASGCGAGAGGPCEA